MVRVMVVHSGANSSSGRRCRTLREQRSKRGEREWQLPAAGSAALSGAGIYCQVMDTHTTNTHRRLHCCIRNQAEDISAPLGRGAGCGGPLGPPLPAAQSMLPLLRCAGWRLQGTGRQQGRVAGAVRVTGAVWQAGGGVMG
jgi:hypothetical protein